MDSLNSLHPPRSLNNPHIEDKPEQSVDKHASRGVFKAVVLSLGISQLLFPFIVVAQMANAIYNDVMISSKIKSIEKIKKKITEKLAAPLPQRMTEREKMHEIQGLVRMME